MARTLTMPLTIGNDGSFKTVTHGHPAEIAQSVALLFDTEPGERRCNPEYGFTSPVFAGVSAELLEAAAAEWEPRADPSLISVVTSGAEQTAHVYLDTTPDTTDALEA